MIGFPKFFRDGRACETAQQYFGSIFWKLEYVVISLTNAAGMFAMPKNVTKVVEEGKDSIAHILFQYGTQILVEMLEFSQVIRH